jgi:hypothetical protein
VPQPDPIEQAEQTVMKDVEKIAEARVVMTHLLHEQFSDPVRQGRRASCKAEEVCDEFGFVTVDCGRLNMINLARGKVETYCRSELKRFMARSGLAGRFALDGGVELLE